jgi:hypothetical protein
MRRDGKVAIVTGDVWQEPSQADGVTGVTGLARPISDVPFAPFGARCSVRLLQLRFDG